jgi:hypothetical protein
MVMANYQGNPLGGIKLPGPESRIAAGAFQILTGGGGGGMGLDTLLGNGGAGGNVPLLPSAGTDPVLRSLALAGDNNPLAALMGGADPSALLTGLVASDVSAESRAPLGETPREKIKRAAIDALKDENFASMLIETNPGILEKIVKLLATTDAGGGGTVG